MFEEYLWVLIVSSILAFFTAFGIGANDVANAFASSVGAKALTMRQALAIASVCEFGGAVLMGAGVTSTIRKGIADLDQFFDAPELLMYGMMCALASTSAWLLIATRLELPVSTTHTVVGSVAGMAIAARGFGAVQWFSTTDQFPFVGGMAAIVLSWFVSPLLAGAVSVGLFLAVRTFVLRHEDSFDRSFHVMPALVAFTILVNAYFIIYQGGAAFHWDATPLWAASLIVAGLAGAGALLTHFVLNPRMRYSIESEKLPSEEVDGVLNPTGGIAGSGPSGGFDEEAGSGVELADRSSGAVPAEPPSVEGGRSPGNDGARDESADSRVGERAELLRGNGESSSKAEDNEPTGGILGAPAKAGGGIWGRMSQAANCDVHDAVTADSAVADIHSRAEEFDPATERCFRYLQVFTAMTNSFAHGSNDVANSIGPYAAVYAIYQTKAVSATTPVPVWILVLGGCGIVAGMACYGHIIMRALGVKMTRLTNTRGFAVELGAALVVVVGSGLGLPLSTTHCMVGGVTAVGLVEGTGGVNWRLLGRMVAGWFATLFVAAGSCALLFAQAAYAPSGLLIATRNEYAAGVNVAAGGMLSALNATGTASSSLQQQIAALSQQLTSLEVAQVRDAGPEIALLAATWQLYANQTAQCIGG